MFPYNSSELLGIGGIGRACYKHYQNPIMFMFNKIYAHRLIMDVPIYDVRAIEFRRRLRTSVERGSMFGAPVHGWIDARADLLAQISVRFTRNLAMPFRIVGK